MSSQSNSSLLAKLSLLAVAVSAFHVISDISAAKSRADMSDSAYQEALRLAQKKASRQKPLNSQSSIARSSSLIRSLAGGDYVVGDHWDVAAWSFENTMARMTSDPGSLENHGGFGGIFHYEVLSVKATPAPEVLLEVTQIEEFGLTRSDPRVKSLRLLVGDRMVQNHKSYQIEDRAGRVHSIAVAPEGIHSAITRLELFPLDMPELVTAEGTRAQSLPALPPRLQSIAGQAGFHPDLGQSIKFEQDDFFGRGMQVIWHKGDPWPAYYKTSNGVAILIRSERRAS